MRSSPRCFTTSTSFYALKRKAAPGVDGVTWQEYEADLELRLIDRYGRIHRGAYRPQPSRRTYIPKADGPQRPLAIAALEDKIIQGATVMVLNANDGDGGDQVKTILRASWQNKKRKQLGVTGESCDDCDQ